MANYRRLTKPYVLLIAICLNLIATVSIRPHSPSHAQDGISFSLKSVTEFDTPLVIVAWHPDGHQLAISDMNYDTSPTFNLMSIDSGDIQTMQTPEAELGSIVTALSYSPDGRYLLVSNLHGPISLWDVTSEEPHHITNHFAPEQYYFGDVSWSPTDSQTVVILGVFDPAAQFQEARFMNVISGEILDTPLNSILTHPIDNEDDGNLTREESSMRGIAWHPSENIIAVAASPIWTGNGFDIQLWDVDLAQLVDTRPLSEFAPMRFAWSPDGNDIVTVDCAPMEGPCQLTVWNLETGELSSSFGDVGTSHTFGDFGPKLGWSPDGQYLVVGMNDAVGVWDVQQQSQVATLNGFSDEVSGVSWSPDGTMIAASSRDGTVRIWEKN